MNRILFSAALVLGGALAAASSGCVSVHRKPGEPYDLEIGSSEPTEADDAPGIWLDRERNTAIRPNPKPIPNLILYFEMIKPDGSRMEVERPANTSNQGFTFFRGKIDLPEGDVKAAKFAIRTKKAGFSNFERIFTYEQVRDASITIVLAPLAGTVSGAPAPKPAPVEEKPGIGTAAELLASYKKCVETKDLPGLRACFKEGTLADERFRALFSDPEKTLKVDTLPAKHTTPEDAIAITVCTVMLNGAQQTGTHAKLALRRVDGAWRITSVQDLGPTGDEVKSN